MKEFSIQKAFLAIFLALPFTLIAQFESQCVAIYPYSGNAPVIDGDPSDAVWGTIKAIDITTPILDETVSFVNKATFKATWDENNVYILLDVSDDNWYPAHEAGVGWLHDKPELYFDVNEDLIDGVGAKDLDGHYQIAPGIDELADQTEYEVVHSVNNDAAYVFEYKIPFAYLTDNQEETLNPNERNVVGFDITINDLDEPGKGGNEEVGRVGWSNNYSDNVEGGLAGESWNSLDQAGRMYFNKKGFSGCESTSGMNDLYQLKEIAEIYPNPVNSTLKLRSDEEIQNISIMGLSGNLLLEKYVGDVSAEINVSDIPPGIYITEIKTEVRLIRKTVIVK